MKKRNNPAEKKTVEAIVGESGIEGLLKRVEGQLNSGELKASLADYIRLLQMSKEAKAYEPVRAIKVTWVDPESKKNSQ